MDKKISFKESDFVHAFTEENSSKIYFPAYRQKYIDQTKTFIIEALKRKKMSCDINVEERYIEVRTNNKTRDPCIFLKSCDFVKLICRCVEIEEAMKVLEDNVFGEIVEIRSLVKSDKVFGKRRDRLIGKNSLTLKALKMLSQCYILISGKTVAIIGSYEGISLVKRIVIDCMNNKHPVYEIKKLMIKDKLKNDDNLKNEDWDRYIPEVKKTNVRQKKHRNKEDRKAKKIPKNNELETGEYFLKQNERE